MKKKLVVLLFAALVLVSASACGGNEGDGAETTGSHSISIPTSPSDIWGTGPVVTDAQGNPIVTPSETEPDISEEAPTFTDIEKELYVWTAVATVRTSTVISEKTACAWPSEGTILQATGESENWYRITYTLNNEEQTCYIAKTVVGDNATIKAFTQVNEEIEISDNVNVRTYPSAEGGDRTVRGILKKGAKVTRVGVGNGWSQILYEVEIEGETDESGNTKTETKKYYISNDCIVKDAADTTPSEPTT